MALLHRINQSKIKVLSHQLSRCCVQTPHASHAVKNPSSFAIASPIWDFCKRSTDLSNNVRFFATSFQGKAKKDEQANSGVRLNDEITANSVRLVTDEGHFVVSLREARERARKLNLDLVQVQGDPPVCKIMDFKREQYKRKMKEKDRAKEKKESSMKKGGCKEVRFLEKTELKDLKMKADSVVRLMERGYRVKCTAVGTPKKGGRAIPSLKGRGGEDLTEQQIAEMIRQEEEEEKERLREVLARLVALIGDEYILESEPRAERKQAFMIVRHAKFGPKKGGGAKKVKDAAKVSTSQSVGIGSSDSVESGAETEGDSLSDEDDENAWSVAADSVDDFDTQNIHVSPEMSSFSRNLDIPNPSQFKPVYDSKQAAGFASSPQQSFEAENRYKRSQPRERYPPTPPRDNRPSDRMDSSRIIPPQFSNQSGRERAPAPPRDNRVPNRLDSFKITPPQLSNETGKIQPGINVSPPMGERKPVQTDFSAFRSAKLPERPNLPTAPNTGPSSYGIFSNLKSTIPGKQGLASEGNNNTEGSQRPRDDCKEPPKWGIFSKDGPNLNPNRISK
ncbi:translation initiation factor 3 (IF-3) family protein [Euphorbia peplus]|nr:translation initiation factor 3 (IF-3) family protein [Euphorbia peplus]